MINLQFACSKSAISESIFIPKPAVSGGGAISLLSTSEHLIPLVIDGTNFFANIV